MDVAMKKEKKLVVDSDMVGFRLGELLPRFEAVVAAQGVSRSAFVREVVSRAIQEDYFDPRAVCAAAGQAFEFVVRAARDAKLVSGDLCEEIVDKIVTFRHLMVDSLDRDFLAQHPEVVAFERERDKKIKEWHKAGRRGDPPYTEHPLRKRWNKELSVSSSDFLDLRRAELLVRSKISLASESENGPAPGKALVKELTN